MFLNTGDIVLFNNRNLLGFFQRFLTKYFLKHKSHITHTAIMYDDTFIAEADWFLRLYPLKRYNLDNVAILRFKKPYEFTEEKKEKLKKEFNKIVGEPYDFINLLTAFFFIVFRKKIKISSKERFICSELVYKLLVNLTDEQKKEFLKCAGQQYCYPYHFANLKDLDFIEVVYQGKNFRW